MWKKEKLKRLLTVLNKESKMKKFIFLVLVYVMAKSVWADSTNRCAKIKFKEDNFCVIAGGTANTNLTVNQAHARSLALKTARILAYEKLAEKVKGILLSSRSKLGMDLLQSAEIDTLVEAHLKNVSFEQEKLAFLADGSPWAEVTLSMPKMKYTNTSTDVLNYMNGAVSNQAIKKSFILDARDLNDSLPLFFTVLVGDEEVISYSPISSQIKFIESIDEVEDGNIEEIEVKNLSDRKLSLDPEQGKALLRYLIDEKFSKESPLYILR